MKTSMKALNALVIPLCILINACAVSGGTGTGDAVSGDAKNIFNFNLNTNGPYSNGMPGFGQQSGYSGGYGGGGYGSGYRMAYIQNPHPVPIQATMTNGQSAMLPPGFAGQVYVPMQPTPIMFTAPNGMQWTETF